MTEDRNQTHGLSSYLTLGGLLFLLLCVEPSTALAQQGDVVLDTATTGESSATPTLTETFGQAADSFDMLSSTIELARSQYAECLAAGVRDAREPIAPLQRRTCEIKYEGDLLRYHEEAERVFNDAAVAFWAQVELLRTDIDALGKEQIEARAELSEAETAGDLIIEQVTALRAAEGAPDTRAEILEYDRLAAAHEQAAIEAARLDRSLQNLERRAAKIESIRIRLDGFGYDFASIALDQSVYSARAEARIEGMTDDLVYESEGGNGGLPEGLPLIVSLIERMRGWENEERAPLPDIDESAGAVEIQPSELGATGQGYDYFEALLAPEATQ